MLNLLKDLCALAGTSGREDAVRDYLIDCIGEKAQCRVDAMGNLLVFKKGAKTPKQTILFSAHMDEVGFIITHVEDNGFLRFQTVGGIDSRVVVGKPVLVEGNIPGVIGTKAVHMTTKEERSKPPKFDDLLIDIGCDTGDEAKRLVQPGDQAVFMGDLMEFGDGKIRAKALDDRAGCALLLSMILSELPYDCYFSFTVNEETGMMGASAAAYSIAPDIAFAVESTTAGDLADVPGNKQVCCLGKGAALSFMDKRTVYHKKLYDKAMEVARREQIPVQPKAGVYGGNEAGALQSAGAGSKTLAISLPCRYIHSPSCVIQKSDLDNTKMLLNALLQEVGENVL